MSNTSVRAAIVAIAAVNLAIGLYAAIAPGAFFRHVGTYGVENGHYVGDVSTAYLAIGAGLLASIRWWRWRVPLLAVTSLWWLLHALNHLGDIDQASSTGKGITDTVLIALGAAAIGYLGYVCSKREVERDAGAGGAGR
jgi:hypothetical protein